MTDLSEIDLITIKKRLADVAEGFRNDKRRCESLAASTDAKVAIHKEYWLELAARHEAQACLVDGLWKGIKP
jgi:hypothetical protein